MDTTQTTTLTPPLYPAAQPQQEGQDKPALSSDFETFLKMLTVQMENQDPLNPVDSADYAVQLATFSSVEQQVLTNDLLTNLASSMSGGGIGALGQWVGMDVRGGSTAQFSGDAIEMVAALNSEADRRVLVVRDATGELAARQDIPVTQKDFTWDGSLSSGAQAATGNYDFSVESYKSGTLLATEPATVFNRVQEARIEDGQTLLVLEGDILLSPDQVRALRNPV